jgi:transposase
MQQSIRYVGLDVHAETIAVAVAEEGRDGEVRSLGTIANDEAAVRKLVGRLGPAAQLRACYEAGPCGYALYWQLTQLGVSCAVVAPTLIPRKAGERVKTDLKDALKLARCYRSGDLTPVWVPDGAHEALRDLVRAREAAKRDELRARHRLAKFLLRQGRRPPRGVRAWTGKYLQWVRGLRFEHTAQAATMLDYLHEVDHAAERLVGLEGALDAAIASAPVAMRTVIAALQALRGVAKVSAVTIVAELGSLARFAHPRQLMGYSGAVPREHSSGPTTRRGAITKAGNAHLRRVVIEASWAYRHRPAVGPTLRARQHGQSQAVKDISWKAQRRLHSRYCRLLARGKTKQTMITAVGRELLGFIWAVGVAADPLAQHAPQAA